MHLLSIMCVMSELDIVLTWNNIGQGLILGFEPFKSGFILISFFIACISLVDKAMEKILFLVLVFDILLIDLVNILILFFDSAFSVILVKVLVILLLFVISYKFLLEKKYFSIVFINICVY